MTRYIQNFLMLLLVFLSQLLYSQTYPVQAVPTVISPYSSKITDYSNAMVNCINLQLVTTDLLVQNRPAQLHLKIQGNGITAQSNPILSGIQPVYLNGGEILSLTSADLAGYFRYQNLQGLTTTQYSEPLPDGVYTICFQVYDVVTRKWLSQNSCATIYLMLNDPPQLNLPSNNEQIPSSDFPNIIFSWTPRHMNATNVSYDYELKEILDPNLDPAFAFELSPLLHKEEGLRTTTLLYDISKPTLIPGKRYAWRVKAISTSGLAENSVFKNNGFSQIHSFTYNSNCDAPRYLLSEQQSQSRVKLMWQGENTHKKYHVQYRKANVENAEWFEVYTVNTQTILQDLEAGFTYEFRVGATCDATQFGTAQSYVYSGIQTFEIDKDENATAYNCGIVPDIEVTNQQPLGAMVINETFMAGDFPVKVLSVQGSSGVFTGTGYIQVPYLFDTRIGVVFDNIRINSDYQLVGGMVETTYDPEWGNVDYVNDLVEVNQQDVKVDFPIDTIEVRNGEIVVTGPNGQTETFPGGKDTVITDSTGNSYYVDADGNVSGPHKQAPGGKPTPENTDGVDKNGEVTALTAEGIKVTFEKINNETQYAFDQVLYKKVLTKEYKEVSGEFVPFKAVPNGKEDKILAKVAITDNNVNADSLIFRTQNGVQINAERVGTTNDFVLKLKGAQKFAWEEVQAAIKQGAKYKVAGVFNFVHISPKTVNVKLVPTSSTVNVSNKIAEIKAIYNQLAIDVQIDVEEPFDIATYLVNDQLPTEDAFGDLSTYSTAQNAIIDAFKKAPGRTMQQAYYLFVTDKDASNGQGGYMRLNNQFGFIFSNTAHTIAHELGHGVFKLEHPFKQYKNKGLKQGDTQGLMDYANGTELLFTDWKQINDPAFKLYAFQGQSDGELAGKVWFTPDWKPFKISDVDTTCNGVRVPVGTVPGLFVDGVCYSATFDEENKFTGYKNEDKPIEITYITLSDNDPIYLYKQDMRYSCGPHPTYKAVRYKYAIEKKENIDYNNNDEIKFNSNWECPQTNVNETYFDIANFELPQGLRFNKVEEIKPEIIDYAVTKLNALIAKNNVGYTYDTEMTNSQLAHIYIDKDVPVGGNDLMKLDHRFVYLSEYTKSLDKGIDIYVLYQKVDMLFNNWNEYAKQVFTKSNLANKNAILITVPYFTESNTIGISDYSVSYFLPGVYAKGIDIATKNIVKQEASWGRRNQYLNPDYQTIFNTQVENFIEQVYTQTHKPSVIYLGLRYADGTIEVIPNTEKIYKPGNAFLKTIILKDNKYYNEIIRLQKPWYSREKEGDYLGGAPTTEYNPDYQEELLRYEIRKASLLELASENKEQDWLDYDNSIQFKEKQLDEQTAAKYITGYAFKGGFAQWTEDLAVVYGGTTNSPPVYEFSNTYNKDGWSTLGPLVYGTIDIASLALSPWALDAMPESIGLFYALKRGDALNTTLYTSAIVIPVLTTGQLRAGMIAKNLATDTKLFFRGSVYTLKADGKLAKVSTSYTRGRILEFFKFSDNAVTPTEIDNFVSAFNKKEIKGSDVKSILNESSESVRASKFKSLSKLVSNDIKVGDIIADVAVQQVKVGTSNKIVIIGRQMKDHVYKVADELILKGKYVEVLDDKYLKKMYDIGYEFVIDGKTWTVNSAWDDMVKNPAWDKYRDAKGYIIDKYLDKTPMYKLNKLWIEKAQIDGATIIDIGYPKGVDLPISTFYEMEKSTVKWK